MNGSNSFVTCSAKPIRLTVDGGCAYHLFSTYYPALMCYRHKEGDSTCFGTACNYTALRLLGVSADHPVMVKARATLHRLGAS